MQLSGMMRRRDFLAGIGTVALLPADPAAGTALQGAPSAAWEGLTGQFQFPPGFTYLNTAGLGPCPRAISERVKAAMDREEESPSPGHSEEDWTRIRGKCAALLGAPGGASEMALVSTATEGINIVLNGLRLDAGDEIVTSTHEHPALAIPLLHKIKTRGVVVRTFEPDLASNAGTLARLRAQVSAKTRAIFVSHVTCTTGQVLPLKEIGALAAERHLWFAVDGAQSLAQFPIAIGDTGAHAFAASCHKWMMGPKRTGILWVRRDRLPDLDSVVLGAYSDASSSLADRRLTLRADAQRFEYGTQNDALVYGIEAACDFVQSLGLERIWEHNRGLADAFRAAVGALPHVALLSPAEAAARSAIVTFRLPGRNNGQVASSLTSQHLRVRSVTEAGLDAVRASFHVCNTRAHVDLLAGAVKALGDESSTGLEGKRER
jgi:selenocysteine lyase/cysteine desulfurase